MSYKPLHPAVTWLLAIGAVVLLLAGLTVEFLYPFNARANNLNQEIQRISLPTYNAKVTSAFTPTRTDRADAASAKDTGGRVQWNKDVFKPVVNVLRARGYTCDVVSNRPVYADCTRDAASGTFHIMVNFFADNTPRTTLYMY